VTPAVLASLQSFTKLESLTLMNLRSLEARHMFHVGTFPALRRLVVVGVPVSDAALVALGERGLLEDLELVGVGPFGAAGMAGLARCGGLRRLVLPKCMQLDAAALAHVGSMTRLEELDLGGVPGVQGNALAGLRRCSALRRLRLADVAIPDDALAALAGLRQLQVLDLSGDEVLTAAGLAQLPVSLTELGLENCPRLDADAAKLLRDRFPRLRVLRVGLNEWLTDDVLRVLVEAPSLERLDVLRCGNLTAASLATIRGASRLRWFRCVGTACIGQQEAAQLRAERPELEIERAVW
jgi:hypothetical protein